MVPIDGDFRVDARPCLSEPSPPRSGQDDHQLLRECGEPERERVDCSECEVQGQVAVDAGRQGHGEGAGAGCVEGAGHARGDGTAAGAEPPGEQGIVIEDSATGTSWSRQR